MYFHYIDLKEAEKRLDANEPTISMQDMRKDLSL